MKGSKRSALFFAISGILLIVQAIVSAVVFDDGIGALAAGAFAFVVFVGFAFAYTGMLHAVTELEYSETTAWGEVHHYRDTGQRVQCTPCWGLCSGIAIIVVTILFAEGLSEDALVGLAPGILGGIFSILAAIVFVMEYKGPYTSHA